jgi:hypothetical protein
VLQPCWVVLLLLFRGGLLFVVSLTLLTLKNLHVLQQIKDCETLFCVVIVFVMVYHLKNVATTFVKLVLCLNQYILDKLVS